MLGCLTEPVSLYPRAESPGPQSVIIATLFHDVFSLYGLLHPPNMSIAATIAASHIDLSLRNAIIEIGNVEPTLSKRRLEEDYHATIF